MRVVEVQVAALAVVGASEVVAELVGVGVVVYACRVNHREGVEFVVREQITSEVCSHTPRSKYRVEGRG